MAGIILFKGICEMIIGKKRNYETGFDLKKQ